MDAVKFIEESNRMCKSFDPGCAGCPASCKLSCVFDRVSAIDAAAQIAIVEKWSAAHPRKTRQSAFLEHYPEARLDEYGVLRFCPSDISAAHRDSGGCGYPEQRCTDCRRKFWMQEVE
nr:MAG TPA: hypothetical protein [Myoviridae sp. ctsKG11]